MKLPAASLDPNECRLLKVDPTRSSGPFYGGKKVARGGLVEWMILGQLFDWIIYIYVICIYTHGISAWNFRINNLGSLSVFAT